jgi:nicotinic acid phosphoribosyltransferase
MKIDDYKKLFKLEHEGGWLDENVWYATCKICEALPVFDKYMIENWNILNDERRKKIFYSRIRRHVNVYHQELISSSKGKLLEQFAASEKAFHFLKNFPFRPYIKEEKLNEVKNDIHRIPMKIWKPKTISLMQN